MITIATGVAYGDVLDSTGNAHKQGHLGVEMGYPTLDSCGRMDVSFATLRNCNDPLVKLPDMEHRTAHGFFMDAGQVTKHRPRLDVQSGKYDRRTSPFWRAGQNFLRRHGRNHLFNIDEQERNAERFQMLALSGPCFEIPRSPILLKRSLAISPPKFARNINIIGGLTTMNKPRSPRLNQAGMGAFAT
jgi:hypothetical protein